MEFKNRKRVIKRPAYDSNRTCLNNQYSNYLYNSKSAFIRLYAYLPFIFALKTINKLNDLCVLDIGCADGPFLPTLNYNINKIFAVDINNNYLIESKSLIKNNLRNSRRINLFCLDAHNFPFIDSKFDLIFCLEVLEHVKDPIIMIKEIFRILKKNGMVICTLPIEIGIPLLIRNLVGKIFKYNRPRYTTKEFLRNIFLKKTGVRPEYIGFKEFMGDLGHKNFDWRFIEKNLRKYFKKVEIKYFPIKILRGLNPFVLIKAIK